MADMHSSLTDKGFRVYWHGDLVDGSDIYFTEIEECPYRALVIDNEGKAKNLYSALKSVRHVNVCNFRPMFQITLNNEVRHIIAFDKRGRRLDTLLNVLHARTFYNGIWITDFLRNSLVDLFNLIHHFIKKGVKVYLDPSTIFVCGDRMMVSKFSWIGGHLEISEYKSLHTLIKGILDVFGQNEDLTQLSAQLETPTQAILNDVPTLPIFWSAKQRVIFPWEMWDAVEDGSFPLMKGVPFGRPFDDVMNDPTLGQWFTAKQATLGLDQNITRRICYLDNDDERNQRNCLVFIRVCGEHFNESKGDYPALPFNTEEELAQAFETFFTGYIWKLHHVAKLYAINKHDEDFMPVESRLLCLREST